MTDFVLYGTPMSPFVRKAEAALHQAGAEYDLVNINSMDMPDWFVEISPSRRIPVLRDKSIAIEGIPGTIPDSSAICM
ncbi:MAG: glutathione S-transferase N-terminal domain-containing protein [Pseudomonadota bacterium]